MAHDPVCGMEVDKAHAGATADYQGQRFYFCSTDCQKEFQADPDKWQPAFESSCRSSQVAGEQRRA